MFLKKDWLAALAVSIFLALMFVGTSLAPAVLLPKSALSADAHALMPDFDEMAVFSAQQSAVEEVAPDELFYWQSAEPLDQRRQEALLASAQKGADGWNRIDYPGAPLLSRDARYIWMTVRLPEEEYGSMALFFKTTNQSVCIWLDGKMIYEYGSMEEKSYEYGTRWHLVPLPAHYAGRCLVFGMHSFHAHDLGNFEHLCLRDMRASVAELFFADLPLVFGLSLVFLMGAIVTLYCITLQGKQRAYRYLLCFLADYALWMVSVMNAKYFLLDWPEFWWYVQLPTTYGFAIFAILFFAELLPEEKCRTMRLLVVPHIFLLLLSILGEIFIARGMMFGCLGLFFPLMLVLSPWVGYVLWLEGRRGNRYCRIALVPLIVIVPLSMFDSLWFYYRVIDWNMYITPFGLLSLVFLLLSTMRMRIREELRNEAARDSLQHEVMAAQEKAQIDPLTGCFNRYKFSTTFAEWVQVAENTDGNLAVIMLDIDFFKSVNDAYGHDEGDHVLRSFANEVRSALDRRHLLIRWGGEEFIILCLHYDLREAGEFAEKLRARVAQASLCHYREIHCSVGVASWHGADKDTSAALLKRADDALYAAKMEGRNGVKVEEPGSLAVSLEATKCAESVSVH